MCFFCHSIWFSYSCFAYSTGSHAVACAGSVVLTQTHPAAPYVCRTGNITLRCQYGGVENVLGVQWATAFHATTSNASTIPGHTSLPRTTTYQEVVVDSYTNLRKRYQCTVVVGSIVSNSNNFMPPQLEGKLCPNTLGQCSVVLVCFIILLQLLK